MLNHYIALELKVQITIYLIFLNQNQRGFIKCWQQNQASLDKVDCSLPNQSADLHVHTR
jgi:hypothetical protein